MEGNWRWETGSLCHPHPLSHIVSPPARTSTPPPSSPPSQSVSPSHGFSFHLWLSTVKCPVLWKCTTSINQAPQEQNWSAIQLTTLKNISLNGPSKILRPHICLSVHSTSPSLESRKLIFSLTELICWGLTPAFPPEKDVRLILQPYLLFSPSQPTRSRRPMPDSIKTLKQFYTSSLMARFVVFVSSSFMTSLLLLLSTFKRLPERGLDWCRPRQRVAEKWSWRPVLWPPRLHATTFARMGQK